LIFDLSRPAAVPCNGCTRCCHGAVPIRPDLGDRAARYETVRAKDSRTGRVLRQKVDGACVYLGAGGCSIYAKRPAICRSFDCRAFYRGVPMLIDRMMSEGARTVRFSPATQAIIDAGKARSDVLESNGNSDMMSNKYAASGADSASQRKTSAMEAENVETART
jgi:uncharacterized protein